MGEGGGRRQERRLQPRATGKPKRKGAQPWCQLWLGSQGGGPRVGRVTSGWWAGLQLSRLRKLIFFSASPSPHTNDDQGTGAQTASSLGCGL